MDDKQNQYELNETSSLAVIPSLEASLVNPDTRAIAGEFLEIGIDSILENDMLKGIPIVESVAAFCKTGIHLRERHFVKETLHFINGFNAGQLSLDEIEKYENRITRNDASMAQELERVVALLNAHIYNKQSDRLGGFYAAYRRGWINWSEFSELSEANMRMFEVDVQVLKDIAGGNTKPHMEDYKAARLASIGLLVDNGPFMDGESLLLGTSSYKCTPLGELFLQYSGK